MKDAAPTEFQIAGMANIGNAVVEEVVKTVLPSIMTTLDSLEHTITAAKAPEKKLRVGIPPVVDVAVSEEKEEVRVPAKKKTIPLPEPKGKKKG